MARSLFRVVFYAMFARMATGSHHRHAASTGNRVASFLWQTHKRAPCCCASVMSAIADSKHGQHVNTLQHRNHWSQNRPQIYYYNRAKPIFFDSKEHHRFYSQLFMSAVDEEEDTDWSSTTIDRTWNMGGLKKEVQRLIFRCHKKVGKANQRLQSAKATVERLTNPDDPSVTMKELENCPDVEALAMELDELKIRLKNLNRLGEELQAIKVGKAAVLPEDVAELALDLGVNDEPPKRKERGSPKKKGPRTMESSRLPYRRYFSANNVEIRVGKQAADNDELSLSPEHRDGSDWWMHASGCPGSHVVIRCGDDKLPEDVVMDAAALAARQSKSRRSKIVKVSMTRCRDVSKPPGAKAGLVRLTGDVRTVTVDMKKAEARFQRLDDTVLIN